MKQQANFTFGAGIKQCKFTLKVRVVPIKMYLFNSLLVETSSFHWKTSIFL